jgi:hypothetical protein
MRAQKMREEAVEKERRALQRHLVDDPNEARMVGDGEG